MGGFPEDAEIWTRRGELARKIADVPSREGVPLTGVQTGPRGYRWRADQPATALWTEALDGGDMKNKVPFRDKVMSIAAPFKDAPAEFRKDGMAIHFISFTEKGVALLTDPIARRDARAPGFLSRVPSLVNCGIDGRTRPMKIQAVRSSAATLRRRWGWSSFRRWGRRQRDHADGRTSSTSPDRARLRG